MSDTITPISLIIVDDHPLYRLGAANALRETGCFKKVVEATNGIEVIKLLESEHFDIVLMDIRMSPLNGMETTAVLHEKFPEVKVIGLSGYNDEYYILEMFSRGAAGYISKKEDLVVIVAAIQEVAEGGTYFPESLGKFLIRTKAQHVEHAFSKRHYIQERFREIIYLLCLGKSSKEIGQILSLSYRTVEQQRLKLYSLIGTQSMAGIIRYGMQIDILGDEELKNKFVKFTLSQIISA